MQRNIGLSRSSLINAISIQKVFRKRYNSEILTPTARGINPETDYPSTSIPDHQPNRYMDNLRPQKIEKAIAMTLQIIYMNIPDLPPVSTVAGDNICNLTEQ